MPAPRHFVCNAFPPAEVRSYQDGEEVVQLDTRDNVNVHLDDVAEVFLANVSPRLLDLLELAAYVYSADVATPRGTGWQDDFTKESWDRDIHLSVGVREPSFWKRDDVGRTLRRLLSFLADDAWHFHFEQAGQIQPVQGYLNQIASDWEFTEAPVVMFSGGLDSLAGALDTLDSRGNAILVSHRPVATIDSRQRDLFSAIRTQFENRALHVPVWVNKDRRLSREYTQRTRSFLYGTLGAVVARLAGTRTIRLFENGVVSLNFPVADEAIRARASRTTHPHALKLMEEFFQLVFETPIAVENPFLHLTKREVVRRIVDYGAAELIPLTCSCQHTGYGQSRNQWHCGGCSQCIDRRIAMVSNDLEDIDPPNDYVIDVFLGERKKDTDRNMAVNYVRHVHELAHMSKEQMASEFNLELGRAIRPFGNPREVADALLEMHIRHATNASTVIERQLKREVDSILDGSLEPNSLLGLVVGRKHLEPIWVRYAERLTHILRVGIPIACKSHLPKNEPHLQEICDAILRGKNDELIREYPFLRWGSVMTKPDWSLEELNLWVELKYVRKKQGTRAITTAISEDIVKYGDNQRRTLFIVYDPDGLTRGSDLQRDVEQHRGMLLRIIR